MVHFDSDYMSGAHPKVLEALIATNSETSGTYGFDTHSIRARRLIADACAMPDAEVWFLEGGTQTNSTVIDALLRPWQGVIATETGHINVHEGGAIEGSAHKVLPLPEHDGKMSPDDLLRYLTDFYADESWSHMVIPGMVYITFPTELGTLYTLDELSRLREVCDKYRLPLYIDGARLGFGLAASPDVTLRDIARVADVFYIGGTKQGLLLGEAVVARKGVLDNFFSVMKRHGAVMAKGRVLGVQFETMFDGDLYNEISRHGVAMAMRLREGFEAKGFAPASPSPTNQQFFTLPNEVIDRLANVATFDYWGRRGEANSTIRLVTGWSTTPADVDTLLSAL